MRTFVVIAVMTTALTGCIMGPRNGDTVSGDVKGKSLDIEGYYFKPSIPVQIQVLKQPGLDTSVDANWDVLTTVTSGTNPLHWNSTDPLYVFTASVTPVPLFPTAAQAARWPKGKLVRLRAIAKDPQGDRQLTVFDSATFDRCFSDNSTQSWSDIGTICASAFSELAVVSTANNPADLAKGIDTYDYLGRKGDAPLGFTDLYYVATGAPADLNGFKTKYGFPSGEVIATYYNEADLGFGREMHCKSFSTIFGAGVACYVKNYGNAAGQPAFPADPTSALNLAISQHGQFATVAMVYTPPNGPNAVKFIVYDANDQRTAIAPLDSTGKRKTVPNNCLACHGISSTVTTSSSSPYITVSSNARFLPFDIFSFKYPNNDSAAQQEAFRKLNALVALTPMSAATSQFLQGLYDGKMPSDPTALATDRFIPPDWDTAKADQTIYTGVVKPFCRGCHMTSTSSGLDFDKPADFDPWGAHPCSATHPMPHAEHTLQRFWNSGARAYLTQRYNLTNDCSP